MELQYVSCDFLLAEWYDIKNFRLAKVLWKIDIENSFCKMGLNYDVDLWHCAVSAEQCAMNTEHYTVNAE